LFDTSESMTNFIRQF